MKLSELIDALVKCEKAASENPEVLLCYEDLSPHHEGFSFCHTEEVADVRVVEDWPLPGRSVIVQENEKPTRVVIFYRNREE